MNKIYRVLLFIVVLSLLCLNISCGNNYKEYKDMPVRNIGDDIIAKLQAGEYGKVEKYLDYLVDKKPFSKDGTRVLEELYDYVAERAGYKELSFDTWCSQNSPHHSSFLFRGAYNIKNAWKARGDGFSYTVSDEGWVGFEDYLLLAEKDLKKAYTLNPDDSYSSSMMLTVCRGLKRTEDEMEEWFQRAIKADPYSYISYIKKLTYLMPKWRGNMWSYTEFAKDCYSNEPGNGVIYEIMLDYIMENAGRARNIKEYYETPEIKKLIEEIYAKTLKRFPESISVRKKYSKIQYDLRKYDEVMKIYNEALDIDPADPVMLLYRGIVYQDNLKKFKLAEQDFIKSIESDPYNHLTYHHLARIYSYQHRDRQKAEAYYTKAIKLKPKAKKYYLWRGVTRKFMKRYPAALEDFNEALKLDELYIYAKMEKAGCLEKLGRIDEAVEYYHKTLELINSEKEKGDAASISSNDFKTMPRMINYSLDRLTNKTKTEKKTTGSKKQQ